MSILSTNQKLIKVGQDYSAGENIGIYEHTISSRNWSPDITYAAESAFQRATGYTEAQISALSGEVSDEVSQLGSDIQYISGVALTSHQSLEGYLTKASGDEYYQPIGSYATVSQLESTSGEIVNLIPTDYVNTETLEQTSGNIVNLIPDTSEFITNASAEQTYQPIGNYLSSNALEGYATQDWVSEQGYLTSVSIPESATWQDVSTTVQTNSAQWAEGGTGDEEVNSFVYNNSATINEVNTSYQTNSGNFLTAAPADMATTGDVAELAQTISETYQVKGDYLTTADSANFYPANNPDGFITGVDLSNYYTKDETSGKEELSNAFANVPTPDYEVESYIHNNSASINSTTDVVQSNSSVWSDVAVYQSNSGTYLTAISIPESASWEEATQAYQNASATYLTAVDLTPYATTAEVDSISSMLSGAIDYVSANAGDEFPASADEAIQYVENNSATINDVNTTYQTNSATYLTAHQAISAEEWNDCYDNVNTNSGAWGGSALPISAGPGVKVNLVDNTLVFSNDETVLYSDLTGRPALPGQSFILSESPLNFDYIEIYLNGSSPTGISNVANGYEKVPYEQLYQTNTLEFIKAFAGGNSNPSDSVHEMGCGYSGVSSTTWTKWYGYAKNVSNNIAAFDNPSHLNIWKVVGINRIAGGN